MNKVPKLRFPEFSGEWEEKKCSNLFDKIRNSVDVEENKLYKQIGIRSHGKGIFYKDEVIGKELGNKRVFWVEPNVFIVNIVFAWERAIARTTENERGMIASHRFPMYKPKEEILDLDYITCFFKTNKGKALLELASPGGAGRNKTLGQKEFDNLKIILPKVEEQKKIGSILSLMDKKIQKQQEKVEALKDYKKCMMQKIFSQEIRFKGENGEEYPEWKVRSFEELYLSISTKNYQIKSSEIQKEGALEVIDQGKEFICGFTNSIDKVFNQLPVIIYGDHTTNVKFRDKEFVVGADGTKLLTNKNKDNNLKFLYYVLYFNNIKPEGYKRHFSILKQLNLNIASSLEEQQKISTFLSTLDKKLEKEQEKLDSLNQWKKGLLQQMFI
ncbi:restriction endonuclease subunit S [Clostridium botulinum]|nr:restriction endonuclease subunit S [Clostridium botulinum]